jgi:peptide/nickel transport system substrate-binding protein
MAETRENAHLTELRAAYRDGRLDRREFLRNATLLGMSAAAAYAFVGGAPAPVRAAEMPRGGRIRIAMRVHELSDPHTLSWVEGSNVVRQVCEYLTRTGHDNVTRPHLLAGWDVSDDLKTWTLHVRPDVTWSTGRAFTADDVIWNLKRVLDPQTGSSVLGLMESYLMTDVETGEVDEDGNPKTVKRLWRDDAIEKLDDRTVRLNCKQPQLAVPEHLFHYPMAILDPEDGGRFGAGASGTGPFRLSELVVGEKAVLTARPDYWGGAPYLDSVEFYDLGDESSAWLAALRSDQVDGLYEMDVAQRDVAAEIDGVEIHTATTAQTGVARVKADSPPYDDARVRMALKLAVDQPHVLDSAYQGIGEPAEHHHVCPIHPEYAELAMIGQDLERARALLAEAGYPDGLDIEIACKNSPPWELNAVQTMVQQWEQVGFRCKIEVMPASSYWDVWTEVPFGFTTWAHRPLGIMVLGLAYRTGVPWNESSYSNPEFDRLLSDAEATLDVDARREIMRRLEEILQNDGPIVQPFWRGLQTAYSSRVKGFQVHPTQYIFCEQLAIEPA